MFWIFFYSYYGIITVETNSKTLKRNKMYILLLHVRLKKPNIVSVYYR